MKTVGSRAEVWHGTAKKTSGGLLKKDLKKNKRGRIVSKKMSNRAKKEKRLEKAGYKTKKGKFTLFKAKKKKGGNPPNLTVTGIPIPPSGSRLSGHVRQSVRNLSRNKNRIFKELNSAVDFLKREGIIEEIDDISSLKPDHRDALNLAFPTPTETGKCIKATAKYCRLLKPLNLWRVSMVNLIDPDLSYGLENDEWWSLSDPRKYKFAYKWYKEQVVCSDWNPRDTLVYVEVKPQAPNKDIIIICEGNGVTGCLRGVYDLPDSSVPQVYIPPFSSNFRPNIEILNVFRSKMNYEEVELNNLNKSKS